MRDAIRHRLSGELPLSQVFFHDMLAIGSMVNIAIGLCAFAMIAADWPIWLPVATFLVPQLYNIILLIAVWRSASRGRSLSADLVKVAAMVWFVIMIFV